jgi:hypothetical protein
VQRHVNIKGKEHIFQRFCPGAPPQLASGATSAPPRRSRTHTPIDEFSFSSQQRAAQQCIIFFIFCSSHEIPEFDHSVE